MTLPRRLAIACALLVAAVASLPSRADTLLMKDGRKLEGTIVEEDADTVTFKVKSITTKFKKDDIDKITRGPTSEGPKDDSDAEIRAKRASPVGNVKLDALRADAAKALDGVAEKRKALTAAAKKIDPQTKAYETQLRKVQAGEAEMKKTKDRQSDAEAKLKAAEEKLRQAKEQTGREPGPLKQDVADAKAKVESVQATAELARKSIDGEKKKLDDETDRFQAAAETLRKPVDELSKSYDALDAAWAALAAEEKRQVVEAPWWPAPPDAARVRLEGRVVECLKGNLLVKVGADADPGQWTEEVSLAAPGVDAKPGETILITARRDKAGWVLEEARR